MAFGVELDSFCERETVPRDASINNVGMQSLVSSKLYGNLTTASCSDSAQTTSAACVGNWDHDSNGSTPDEARVWTPASTGPGKENFIGFSSAGTGCNSPGTTAPIPTANLQIVDVVGSSPAPAQCQLLVTAYEMGVAGHLSGADFIGVSVNNNGVVSETSEGTYAVVQGPAGVCI
ncbi:MAG: hypothetical protein OXK80_00485 [Bdellovibrionales bacterium]|nr:hypothetical protein [Bdellovibrionales bacterium]